MSERLQKIIARAGISSRRAGEELILAGRVRVNGHIVTELGAKADVHNDTIEVDGKRLVSDAPRYILLHKPRNVVSTLSDPEGRPTVAELLKEAGLRLYPVGRLDFATSGVLLVTNDGDFANGLLHPRGGVPKTYVLKVKGLMKEEDLERWATGVKLDDGVTLPAELRKIRYDDDKTWIEITIREGRNQQIRRMGEATGFPVMRLARVAFAGITHDGLRPGSYRSLTVEELDSLRKNFGVPKRIRGAVMGEHNVAPPKRTRPAREANPRGEHAPRGRGDRAAAARRDHEETGAPARRGARPVRREDAGPPARRDARPVRRDDAGPPAARRDARPARREDAGPPAARRDARPARRDDAGPPAARRDARPARREDAGPPAARRDARPARREDAGPPVARRDARPARRDDAGPPAARRDARPARREDAGPPARPARSRDGASSPSKSRDAGPRGEGRGASPGRSGKGPQRRRDG